MIARANPETLLGRPASSASPVSDHLGGTVDASSFVASCSRYPQRSGSTCRHDGLAGKRAGLLEEQFHVVVVRRHRARVLQVRRIGVALRATARRGLQHHVVGEDRNDAVGHRVLNVEASRSRRWCSRSPSRCRCSRRRRDTDSGTRTARCFSSPRRRQEHLPCPVPSVWATLPAEELAPAPRSRSGPARQEGECCSRCACS